MTALFLKVLNMSISASWLVLAVLLLRILLKKAPKWITILLWGMVAVRLICPISIESVLSLLPSGETISREVLSENNLFLQTGTAPMEHLENPSIENHDYEGAAVKREVEYGMMDIFAILWLIGMICMICYTLVSYLRLLWRVDTAVLLRGNIYQSEMIHSPFVLGIVRPKIYVPFRMTDNQLHYVIAHEKAHIKRKDHIWKPFGFALLVLHWFNPLMWLSYALMCKDIEYACDEKVIQRLMDEQRADYSQTLLSCSAERRLITACPLAFGEVSVKDRVNSVLHYKKPAFWVVVASVLACIAIAVCFLTNPKSEKEDEPEGTPVGTESGSIDKEQNGENVVSQNNGSFTDGVELRADLNGDGEADSIFVKDIPSGAEAYTQLTAVVGDVETTKDYEGYYSSDIVTADLSGNGKADVLLVRYDTGSTYGAAEISLLYYDEDGWKEYPKNFIHNPDITLKQPDKFGDAENWWDLEKYIGASLFQKDGKTMVRFTALWDEDASQNTVKVIEASYRDEGWYIENIELVGHYDTETAIAVGDWVLDAEKTQNSLKQYSMRDLFGTGFAYGHEKLRIQDDGTMQYYISIGVDDGSGTYTINGNVLTYNSLSGETAPVDFELVEINGQTYLQQVFEGETLYWKRNDGNASRNTNTMDEAVVDVSINLYGKGSYLQQFDDYEEIFIEKKTFTYYYILPSNITSNSFDFTIKGVQVKDGIVLDSEEDILLLMQGTAYFVEDGKKAVSNDRSREVYFLFRGEPAGDYIRQMEVEGIPEMEGHVYVNSQIPGYEFG